MRDLHRFFRGSRPPSVATSRSDRGPSRFRIIAGALLLITCLAAAEERASIRTNDGLMIEFARDGRVSAIQLDGRVVPVAKESALFRIRDAASDSAFAPVISTTSESSGGLVLVSRTNSLGLDVRATIVSRGDFLQIDGEVADANGGDRCVDLKISLPAVGDGFVADTGLLDGAAAPVRPKGSKKKKAMPAKPADHEAEIDESNSEDNAWYPLAPTSNRSTGVGLTLAVPPTHPTRFVTGLDATGTFITLRIGISAAAAIPGRTPFRVTLYRHDPTWGFRAALARYYTFYREDFFTRHAKRIGAWTTQNASKLAHPELYAYHESGFPTWRHPAGTDSGVNMKLTLDHLDEGPIAHSLEDYERLCELALDEKHGIYSLPYTIVGQRQLLQLPALPRDFAAAMQTLNDWQPKESIRFDGPPQATSFRSAEELKSIIRNSGIHDAQHRAFFMARPYRGPTLTFAQNPNPNLFRGEGRPTIASYTLDYYVPMMLQSNYVDGIYMDSLGRWCGLHNFRTEHFKFSTVPLTYGGSPVQPSLWNLQSHAEYMWEAGTRLHAQKKILMANGVGPDRVMLGFACDVMGREGAPGSTLSEEFYTVRVAAGSKPYCLLNATHRSSPRLWAMSLYMGYLMGCNDPKALDDEARYLPLVIKCNEAGWEPITHARVAPAEIGVERWGGQGGGSPLLFTVMNRSSEPRDAVLTIDLAALQCGTDARAKALLDKLPIAREVNAQRLVLRFRLGAEEANVIEISG